MKKFMPVIVILLMVLLVGISCAEKSVQSQSSDAVEWKIVHYKDQSDQYIDHYYLNAIITGQAVAKDGGVQAAYMSAFVSEDGLTFALFAEGTRTPIHNSGEDSTNPVSIRLEDMGLRKDATALFPKDSSEWFFQDEEIGGMSINDLIIIEMRQYGTVNLTIPFMGWGGRTDNVPTQVSFSIPSNGSNFTKLYSSAIANEWKEDVSTSEAQAKATLASGALVDSFAPILDYAAEVADSVPAAKPMLTLNLDITLQKNATSNPKMNLYVDGQKITTIKEGETFQRSYSLEYGGHSISIEHDGNVWNYVNTYSFDLESDNATIKLSVKDHDVMGYYEVSVKQAGVSNWKETRK